MHLSFLSIKAFRRIIHEIYYDREIVHFIRTPFRTRFQIMIFQYLRVNIDLLENPSAKKKDSIQKSVSHITYMDIFFPSFNTDGSSSCTKPT